LEVSLQFNARYTALLVPNTAHIVQFTLCELWPGHIQCIYSCAYSDFNIHLNVSALLLYISRQLNARYTAFLVSNIAHILQLALCDLWSRPLTKYFQHRIFRLQYSCERICAALGNISTIQCSLNCKLGAKYSAHPTVYAM
jgi:hypothetical protein